MTRPEKVLCFTPLVAILAGGLIFGAAGFAPLGVFPFGGIVFEAVGRIVLRPFGVTDASAATYSGIALFVLVSLGVIFLGAHAKDRNNTKLSIVVCVLFVGAYLFVCSLIAPHAAPHTP